MGFPESLNYVLYDNPISQSVISCTKQVLKPILNSTNGFATAPPTQIIYNTEPLWKLAQSSGPFVKVAGISGALAVSLAAYGAHKKYPKDQVGDLKAIYESASKIHFIHTLAILGVPLAKYPVVSGSMFMLGTLLFTGPCYYHAFSGENKFGKVAPIGGTVLILAWVSLIF